MRIWILSDLHLEYADLPAPLEPPDADVCVMAGDLCRGIDNGIRWLAKNIAPAMPCIYVAGNHEFYKGSIKEGIAAGRAAAMDAPDVHFLENDTVTIGGVRFLGATLWTDFRIERVQHMAMHYARERMNDYRKIALQRKPWKRFRPETAARMHHVSRQFIEETLLAERTPTVVVTHHLPHRQSIPKRFAGDLLNAAYASNLSEIIQTGSPALWVHGHMHDSCDYLIGETRIVSNPRGYGGENGAFDVSLVINLLP